MHVTSETVIIQYATENTQWTKSVQTNRTIIFHNYSSISICHNSQLQLNFQSSQIHNCSLICNTSSMNLHNYAYFNVCFWMRFEKYLQIIFFKFWMIFGGDKDATLYSHLTYNGHYIRLLMHQKTNYILMYKI